MSDEQSALIEVRGLTKKFKHRKGELEVLRGVDLRLFAGDMAAIMGSSGAGKSTLLQIAGALDVPTGGTYLFDGEDVFKRSSSELARFRNEQIGFVFQFHHLLPEFTALENVMMPGLIARQKRATVEQRAMTLLEQMGLSARVNHQPGELSGGEQQRVAIARALYMAPRLLLADEPTGNLDQQTSAGIHGLLKSLNQETNVTVIVVTHDPLLAAQLPVQLKVEAGRIFPLREEDGLLGGRLSAPGGEGAREA